MNARAASSSTSSLVRPSSVTSSMLPDWSNTSWAATDGRSMELPTRSTVNSSAVVSQKSVTWPTWLVPGASPVYWNWRYAFHGRVPDGYA